MESSLTSLFAILADFKDSRDASVISHKAHVIFDTIVSFETRLQIVDSLMAEEGLSELDLETWAKCSSRLMKFYKKRHQLAHFSIVAEIHDKGQTLRFSPFLTFGKMMRREFKYLSVDEINERKDKFRDLQRAVSCLSFAAQQRRGLHQEFPTPEVPLTAHLRELARQSLAKRQQQPNASQQ